ncbi:MAG: S8 family serine peptidase [Coprococcus catus]
MVENYDDISCEDVIYSEDYRDYIKEYFQDFSSIAGTYHPVCIEAIGSRYAVMHLAGDTSMQNILSDYNISMLPALYGLLGTAGLEESGILYFHRSPYLNLRGSGVMIGVIDTGIDYRHQAFTYEDRTTKIYSIWDQTIRDGESPEGFIYGTEYTSEQINRALAAENSLAVVPSQDENGHGTFIAGVAAGRVIESEDFSGAAPEASLCIVKLKPCKQYLRQFYGTAADVPAYQENDIMAGISYCIQKAKEARMPVIILLGVGTNSGGHTGQSYLSQLIDDISGFSGVCVVTAVGGEADKRHHFWASCLRIRLILRLRSEWGPGRGLFRWSCGRCTRISIPLGFSHPPGRELRRSLQLQEEARLFVLFWIRRRFLFIIRWLNLFPDSR